MRAEEAKLATEQAKVDNYNRDVARSMYSVNYYISDAVENGKNFTLFYEMYPEVMDYLVNNGYTVERMGIIESMKESLFNPYISRYRISW